MTALYLTSAAADAAVTADGASAHWLAAFAAGGSAIHTQRNTTTNPASPLRTTDSATPGTDGTVLYWYSKPLQAVTIAGAITALIWCRENATANNVAPSIQVARVQADGTFIENIVAEATNHGAGEMATTAGGASDTISVTAGNVTDRTLNAGDRIRISLWIDNAADQAGTGTMASGGQGEFWVNGPNGAQGQAEISFTETLVELVTHTASATTSTTATATATAAATKPVDSSTTVTAATTATSANTKPVAASLMATASIAADDAVTKPATATVSVTGTVTADAAVQPGVAIDATVASNASIAATATTDHPVQAAITATGTVTATAGFAHNAATAVTATAALGAAAETVRLGTAALSATATTTAAANAERPAVAAVNAAAVLDAAAEVVQAAVAELLVTASVITTAESVAKVTYRPDLGVTARPDTGTTLRP